jgi:hypothetical protein
MIGAERRKECRPPRLGSHKSAARWQSRLAQRGWTLKEIAEAIATGRHHPAANYVRALPDLVGPLLYVMAGLVPAIHVFLFVDARHKAGHDGFGVIRLDRISL